MHVEYREWPIQRNHKVRGKREDKRELLYHMFGMESIFNIHIYYTCGNID